MRRLIARLHANQDCLFQRVLLGVQSSSGPWFTDVPKGHNMLGNMMPLLSVRAQLSFLLSTRYTNHCIRASVVTDLKDTGFRITRFAQLLVTNVHESSLQNYDQIGASRRPLDMADVLDGKSPPAKKPCTELQLRAHNAQDE